MSIDEHDQTDSEERQLAALFEQVQAPPGTRRWRGVAARGERGRRVHLGGRRTAPLLAAAGLAVAVGAAGALVGTGHLGPSRSSGVAGSGSGGPSPRTGAAMAWDGATHSVILFGGRSATGNESDTWSWDGNGWRQLFPASSPPPRSGAPLIKDGHGGLVLFGGMGNAGAGINLPACVPPVPQPAASGTASAVPPGAPAAIRPGFICDTPLASLTDTWIWDGHTWTQRHPSHAPQGVVGAAAFDSGTGSAVVLVHPLVAVTAVPGEICVGTGTAVPLTASPKPTLAPARPPACRPGPITQPAIVPSSPLWRWTGSDWVSLAGPADGSNLVGLATDPAGGVLAVTAAKPSVLSGSAAIATNTPLPCPPAAPAAGHAPICPPFAPPVAPVPPDLQVETLHLDGGGSWRVVGTSSGPVFGGMWVGDPAHHQVVDVGGNGGTEVWDGHAWTSSAAPGPGLRGASAAAYDEANQRVVLFGGATPGGLAADTWTWDGSRWTRAAGTTPTASPGGMPGSPIEPVNPVVITPPAVIGSSVVPTPFPRVTPG